MKKVIICTNIPAPYSVDFYNELGQYCDLTVVYERYTSSERNAAWKGDKALNFNEIYLKLKPVGVEQARGSAVRDYVKRNKSDVLIFANYASPASLEAILWCRINGRKYIINWDGGFNKKEPFFKRVFKKIVLGGAEKHIVPCNELNQYLLSIGIHQDHIFHYHFSSVRDNEILNKNDVTFENKKLFKKKLDIREKKMVLAVGQMIRRKGIDILLHSVVGLRDDVGIYIVGGKASNEIIELIERLNLKNIHIVDFKTKKDLADYYQAADVFVFTTREDIWGLVVNEAMSFGLPVVSSSRSIAAQELIRDGYNGIMAEPENSASFHRALRMILDDEKKELQMGKNSLEVIKGYTIEEMTSAYKDILKL